ncbi:MAG: hypothetical protein JO329_17655 [Planctomycetaceae bacterium]|nr:hypothetical protein [Planctomycetaceae bacterium]
MLWRPLCLARAWSAAGLLTCSMLVTSAPAEPSEPAPPADAVTEIVQVLKAGAAGDLNLDVRGQGRDRVRVAIRNTSVKRLNVVLPPGLVAASAIGQARPGGGFQSMGLGSISNPPGAFGEFQDRPRGTGFQSVAPDDVGVNTVIVPAGQTVEMSVPAVCLNFGLPTPTSRDRFELVDVDDYTRDPRARKALRTLATTGTSHGVAQAAAWRVFNHVPFELMLARASNVVNVHEVALASRLVLALDTSPEGDRIDPADLTESRVFVRIQGDCPLADEAKRLAGELGGLHLLGLPVRVVGDDETPNALAPALYLKVILTGSQKGETRGRLLVLVSFASPAEDWSPLGKTTFIEGSSVSVLDGPGLARALDRALAFAFVGVTTARHGPRSTTLRVENRLPFSLARVMIKPSGSSGSVAVPFKGVGIGPARAGRVSIEAPGGTVDRVTLTGL